MNNKNSFKKLIEQKPLINPMKIDDNTYLSENIQQKKTLFYNNIMQQQKDTTCPGCSKNYGKNNLLIKFS